MRYYSWFSLLGNLSNFSKLIRSGKNKKEAKKSNYNTKFTWFTTKGYVHRVVTKFN